METREDTSDYNYFNIKDQLLLTKNYIKGDQDGQKGTNTIP